LGFVGLEASILANLYAMQNPVPDAPPERPERQDAGIPNAPPANPPRPVAEGAPVGVAGPPVVEIDGPSGPEPTRYGDWERKGRCIDF
jgi:hypothetical protein